MGWLRTVAGWVMAGPLRLVVVATWLLLLGNFLLFRIQIWQPTYSAEVRTEIVSISASAPNTHRWFMVEPRVQIDFDTLTVERGSGFVELFGDVDVNFSRRGNGELLVQIESVVDDRSVPAGPDGAADIRPTAIFHWDSIDVDATAEGARSGRLPRRIPRADTAMTFLGLQMDPTDNPLTFPFVGWATLGADVPAERRFAPMLLSGRVEIYGKTRIGNQRYRAGGAELEAGDKFTVLRPSPDANGYGVVRIDPPDRAEDFRGVMVTYHAEGKAAEVNRFGTGGHRLRMSWLALVTSNPLFGVLAVVVLAIYTGIITAACERMLAERARS